MQTVGFDALELSTANALFEQVSNLNAGVQTDEQPAAPLSLDVGATEEVVTTSVVYANTIIVNENVDFSTDSSEVGEWFGANEIGAVPRSVVNDNDNAVESFANETNGNENVSRSAVSVNSHVIESIAAESAPTVTVPRTSVSVIENAVEPAAPETDANEIVPPTTVSAAFVNRPCPAGRDIRSAGTSVVASTSGTSPDSTPILAPLTVALPRDRFSHRPLVANVLNRNETKLDCEVLFFTLLFRVKFCVLPMCNQIVIVTIVFKISCGVLYSERTFYYFLFFTSLLRKID